jgi:hypothetical protein
MLIIIIIIIIKRLTLVSGSKCNSKSEQAIRESVYKIIYNCHHAAVAGARTHASQIVSPMLIVFGSRLQTLQEWQRCCCGGCQCIANIEYCKCARVCVARSYEMITSPMILSG